ncbi:uncharacterized protein V1516DRAFT_681513 [Lipomyces oligophaga]|uniref:uncharacterized protein n=1 Tax=Lipomyces oligophaga TaxID=45792 RepID=UPI0034CF23E7
MNRILRTRLRKLATNSLLRPFHNPLAYPFSTCFSAHAEERLPSSLHQTTSEQPSQKSQKSYELPKTEDITAFKRFSKPVRIGFVAGGIIWVGLLVKVFIFDRDNDVLPGDLATAPALDPSTLSTFILTHREEISPGLYLIELSPPYEKVKNLQSTAAKRALKAQLSHDPPGAANSGLTEVWDGSRTWSVEIVQPQLQVVRKYTPLPMFYNLGMRPSNSSASGSDAGVGERTSLLRLLGDQTLGDEGKFVLLIRRYADGEVSRYLTSIPIQSRVLVRGPFTEFTLPICTSPRSLTDPKRRHRATTKLPPVLPPLTDRPSTVSAPYPWIQDPLDSDDLLFPRDIVFFAAGTGIAPALQLLLSRNPPPGLMQIHYCIRTRADIAVPRFLLFLEKTGRARIIYHIDDEGSKLSVKDIPSPVSGAQIRKYVSTGKGKLERELFYLQSQPDIKFDTALEWASEKSKSIYNGKQPPVKPAFAIVCGPEAFINYVAGQKANVSILDTPVTSESHASPDPHSDQGSVGGLLKKKGWTELNVYKL